jgi:hypothetical protein
LVRKYRCHPAVVSGVPKFDYGKSSTIIQVSVEGPDPDPDGSAFILIGWIRIQEDTNSPQKSEDISSFEVLDVLFLGIKTYPVAWMSFMEA